MSQFESGPTIKEIWLRKVDETFVFRYPDGDEQKVVDAITALANDPNRDFCWVDAAFVVRELYRPKDSNSKP